MCARAYIIILLGDDFVFADMHADNSLRRHWQRQTETI